jgi:hypothetical protein
MHDEKDQISLQKKSGFAKTGSDCNYIKPT